MLFRVDLQAFAPREDQDAVRRHLGVPEGRLFVLALGRLVEKKGFADLIDAAALTPGVHVVLAGAGDLEGELRAQARARGAAVSFAGAIDREAVAAALGAADVVVVPSVRDRAGNVDGLPNVLLEALGAGCAVVATRVAGIPDVIRDGENGLLVPERDPAALASALTRLHHEPQTRRQLGAAARRTVEETFTWGAAVSAFSKAYVEAAALDAR